MPLRPAKYFHLLDIEQRHVQRRRLAQIHPIEVHAGAGVEADAAAATADTADGDRVETGFHQLEVRCKLLQVEQGAATLLFHGFAIHHRYRNRNVFRSEEHTSELQSIMSISYSV